MFPGSPHLSGESLGMRLGELSDCELALVYILERCNKYRYKSEQSKDSESLSRSETTESLPLTSPSTSERASNSIVPI